MFKKTLNTLISLASAIFMLNFAIPKLSAAEVSVKSFTQFAQVLPLNGEAYMYFVGVLELTVALIFIFSLFIGAKKIKAKVTLLGVFLLTGTLLGALATEFFVRPEPIDTLVVLSSIFITTSIVQLAIIRKDLTLNK